MNEEQRRHAIATNMAHRKAQARRDELARKERKRDITINTSIFLVLAIGAVCVAIFLPEYLREIATMPPPP